MIAVSTCLEEQKTHKVKCPECRGRICDMVLDDCNDCRHKNKIITTGYTRNQITIKCQKCGLIVGLAIFDI